MIKLRKFNPKDADTITKWLKDEKTFYQWSADRYSKYPISADDINEFYYENRNDFLIFTATDDDNRIIGHFILRYPNKNDKTVLRMGFIIIDDSLRGKGVGKQMIMQGIKFSFEQLKAQNLTLGVFENNPGAYFCYKSCGFEETGQLCTFECKGESWNCIELQLNLKKYKQIFNFL